MSKAFPLLLLCGFRKEYSTQYALMNLLPKWKRCLNSSEEIVRTLLMDLSKAHDSFSHDLIIAKLEANEIGENWRRLIQNFLSQRQQRVKSSSSVSEWLEIILRVPQGSILESIFFNVFINDLLLFMKNIHKTFKQHIQKICHQANKKTKALFHIRTFLNLEQAQVSAEAYISSNFRYCLLIWIFCGKMSDNLRNN